MFPLLSSIVFLPLLAAFAIIFIPKKNVGLIRALSLVATFAVMCLTILLLARFDGRTVDPQFVERAPWIGPLNVWYFLGVDGISAAMVFLSGLLGFLACAASYKIEHRHKEYFIFYLVLMTGMLGTFVALDLFLFYIFWEAVLIPMYFLIGIWGGPRKEYAAIKFILYTLSGSVLMLVGILIAYFTSNPHTFDMLQMAKIAPAFDFRLQLLLFLAFYIAFAIKVPVFPFHTWLPDAHVEAPTPISVLLAGVLLKMGCYGFFRICFPFFPQAAAYLAYPLAVLGAVNLIYGALVAMAQKDFKKMIAYSSVSHMGFVLLGLASLNMTGFNGALLEMFNHGIITGGMFLLVGVLYDRAHTRELERFGGLSGTMPVYAFFLTFCTLGSLGLPGLSGFVGEFLSLFGAYPAFPTLTMISCLGLIITAGYFLYMLQQVLLGPVKPNAPRYPDMSKWEVLTLVPLVILIAVVGFYPKVVLQFQQTALEALVTVR